jgi:DNA-directed RNA polymerase subunit RPC12/RpoP
MVMSTESQTVKCGNCGQEMTLSTADSLDNTVACPRCGSPSRAICISGHDEIMLRERIAMKSKEEGIRKPRG